MNNTGQQFIVIEKSQLKLAMVESIKPFIQISSKNSEDIEKLVRESKNTHENETSEYSLKFNLPFVLGENLIIPIKTTDVNREKKTLIFGGQILIDSHDDGGK